METLPRESPDPVSASHEAQRDKSEALSGDPDIKTDSLAEVTEILLEGLPLPPAAVRADPLERHGDWSHVDRHSEAGLVSTGWR